MTSIDLEYIASRLEGAIAYAQEQGESFHCLKGGVGEIARQLRERPSVWLADDAPGLVDEPPRVGVPLSALIVAADLVRPELVDLREDSGMGWSMAGYGPVDRR